MKTILFSIVLCVVTCSLAFGADGNIHGVATSCDRGTVILMDHGGTVVKTTKIVQQTFWFTDVECPGEYVVEVHGRGLNATKPVSVGCDEPVVVEF